MIRVGDRGIISPLEASGRRWMREHSTVKIRAACYNSMIVLKLAVSYSYCWEKKRHVHFKV